MKSDRGEIEVFLCPEEDALGVCSNIEDSETDNQSPIKIKREGQINYNAPQLHAYISSSLSSQTKMESNNAGGSNGGPSSYSNTLEVTSAASSSWDAPSRNSASGDVEENQVKRIFLVNFFQNFRKYTMYLFRQCIKIFIQQANQLSNVLIWESEDLGPIGTRFQHQTVDQDHHNGN